MKGSDQIDVFNIEGSYHKSNYNSVIQYNGMTL